MSLTPEQQARAVQLLDIIVRPGDHDFHHAIEEAQKLLGYERRPVRFNGRHPRARCHLCFTDHALNGDGRFRTHRAFSGSRYTACEGSGMTPSQTLKPK